MNRVNCLKCFSWAMLTQSTTGMEWKVDVSQKRVWSTALPRGNGLSQAMTYLEKQLKFHPKTKDKFMLLAMVSPPSRNWEMV